MITFKKLRYKNLLSSGNVFTELDLCGEPTTLVIGTNGAGKSSFLDALSFGLYGRPFRKIVKNQLINSINQKNLVVELEFETNNREYKIIRGIKPNIFEVYQDGNLINQNADAREYQELLEKNVIKMNHKSFSQIVVLGSASFVPFMQLQSSHRREIIEDLLDIQIFSTMAVLLKSRMSETKTKTIENNFFITNLSSKIDVHREHLAKSRASSESQIKAKESALVEKQKYVAEQRAICEQLSEQITALDVTDADQARANLERAKTIQRDLVRKRQTTTKMRDFFVQHDTCPTCNQGITDDHRHPKIEANEATLAQIETALNQLQVRIDKMESRIDEIESIERSIEQLKRTLNTHKMNVAVGSQLVAAIQADLEDLNDNTTNQQLDTSAVDELQQQLNVARKTKDELAKQTLVLDAANFLLKDNGIKTAIIKQYIPVINKLINKHLSMMDFFVNFELSENFTETIKSRFRDEFSYESFSEGEKSRLNLALLFTWRALAKMRNSISTNLLIFDEILDSSLDTNGLDEFMKIISTLAGDTNVFIISHRETAIDKFTNVIKFEKHKNFSRIAQ